MRRMRTHNFVRDILVSEGPPTLTPRFYILPDGNRWHLENVETVENLQRGVCQYRRHIKAAGADCFAVSAERVNDLADAVQLSADLEPAAGPQLRRCSEPELRRGADGTTLVAVGRTASEGSLVRPEGAWASNARMLRGGLLCGQYIPPPWRVERKAAGRHRG